MLAMTLPAVNRLGSCEEGKRGYKLSSYRLSLPKTQWLFICAESNVKGVTASQKPSTTCFPRGTSDRTKERGHGRLFPPELSSLDLISQFLAT
jgi:hypothetical protein